MPHSKILMQKEERIVFICEHAIYLFKSENETFMNNFYLLANREEKNVSSW